MGTVAYGSALKQRRGSLMSLAGAPPLPMVPRETGSAPMTDVETYELGAEISRTKDMTVRVAWC
eukprot:COSAG05_NODE_10659_length_553_cov_0.947137_1_plen_63_part_01